MCTRVEGHHEPVLLDASDSDTAGQRNGLVAESDLRGNRQCLKGKHVSGAEKHWTFSED